MRASAVREVYVAGDSGLLAAALYDRQVQVWSWKTGEKIGKYNTVYSFGGRRLVLTPDGRTLIAAGWGRGLEAYAIPTGSRIWRGINERGKSIGKIQRLALDPSGQILYCGVEASTVLVIDVTTGKATGRINRTKAVYPSQFGHRDLMVKKDSYVIRGKPEVQLPNYSLGLYAVAFSADSLCLSDGSGTHCIDLASSKTNWHRPDLILSACAFNLSDGSFHGVSLASTASSQRVLTKLPGTLEKQKPVLLTHTWDSSFTASGEHLVTSDGDVFETQTGALIRHLEFPLRDYPDPAKA